MAKENYNAAYKADYHTHRIPFVWHFVFNQPQPGERSRNINASIGRICSTGKIRFDLGQEVGKGRQRHEPGHDQPYWFMKAKPSPKRVTARNFRKSREDIENIAFEQTEFSFFLLIIHTDCALTQSPSSAGSSPNRVLAAKRMADNGSSRGFR
jgi:hypothetical protein